MFSEKPINRSPTKQSFFELLLVNKINVEIVCDIGVHQFGTAELMIAFPEAKHLLVEPVLEFKEPIERLYSHIPHRLYQIGLGAEEGRLKLKLQRSDSDDVSHSQLGPNDDDQENSYSVDVKTLDWLVSENPIIKDITTLLKLDVDGKKKEIIKGAGTAIKYFDLIMIEMPVRFYFERLNILHNLGFYLLDIVDPTYYHGHLSQVDMVFASPNFLNKNKCFLPWEYYDFQWNDYQHWTTG